MKYTYQAIPLIFVQNITLGQLDELSPLAEGIHDYLLRRKAYAVQGLATIEELGQKSKGIPYKFISAALDELIALGLVTREEIIEAEVAEVSK